MCSKDLTLRTPSLSRKGSKRNRLDFRNTVLLSLRDWRLSGSLPLLLCSTLISSAKASSWAVRTIKISARLDASRVGPLLTPLSVVSWSCCDVCGSDFILNLFALMMSFAMARWRVDHSEKRPNRSDPNPRALWVLMAWTFTSCLTSGRSRRYLRQIHRLVRW
jgi:hypothetical protein